MNYLLFYYEKPSEKMKEVWNAGQNFDLDGFKIEEKILAMVLFTRSGTEGDRTDL